MNVKTEKTANSTSRDFVLFPYYVFYQISSVTVCVVWNVDQLRCVDIA